MRLHTLTNRPGAKHRVKRLGCGESSGHGKTSTRGGKGQTARSGGSLKIGFEGGQTRLIVRMPRRGFNNAAHTLDYAIVNVDALNAFDDGATVGPKELEAAGALQGRGAGVKVLGEGDLKKKLTVQAHKFSGSAKEKIEKAGGACEVLALPVAPGARNPFGHKKAAKTAAAPPAQPSSEPQPEPPPASEAL
jgi:large subunit ribosomal protein L15